MIWSRWKVKSLTWLCALRMMKWKYHPLQNYFSPNFHAKEIACTTSCLTSFQGKVSFWSFDIKLFQHAWFFRLSDPDSKIEEERFQEILKYIIELFEKDKHLVRIVFHHVHCKEKSWNWIYFTGISCGKTVSKISLYQNGPTMARPCILSFIVSL